MNTPNPTRAPKKPINQPIVFAGSLADLRRANGQDADMAYVEAYACPADLHFVTAQEGYLANGTVYCNRACYDEAMMIEEAQA